MFGAVWPVMCQCAINPKHTNSSLYMFIRQALKPFAVKAVRIELTVMIKYEMCDDRI
jgi:hypothetical protein